LIRPPGAGEWDKIWEKSFSGLQIDWKDKPWPMAAITLDRDDGPFELRFETEGTRGVKFDQLAIGDAPAAQVQDYATWRAAEFQGDAASDDLVSGPDADPDADRVSNLVEFLLKKPPTVAGDWYGKLEVEKSGYLRVGFTRNPRAVGATMHLEVSSDLNQWMRVGRERIVGEDEQVVQAVEVAIPPMDTAAEFLRIRAVASETP
jgi:hypothetical protein